MRHFTIADPLKGLDGGDAAQVVYHLREETDSTSKMFANGKQ